MADLPILFNAPMVRATLADLKTKTRRTDLKRWAKVKPGDRIWVREAFYLTDDGHSEYAVYAADVEETKDHLTNIAEQERRFPQLSIWHRHRKLRPSIHMPRWASRITLEVTDVRVERLLDISEEDALAEGVHQIRPRENNGWRHFHWDGEADPNARTYPSPIRAFAALWQSINGEGSWLKNPEVAVISFRRIQA